MLSIVLFVSQGYISLRRQKVSSPAYFGHDAMRKKTGCVAKRVVSSCASKWNVDKQIESNQPAGRTAEFSSRL